MFMHVCCFASNGILVLILNPCMKDQNFLIGFTSFSINVHYRILKTFLKLFSVFRTIPLCIPPDNLLVYPRLRTTVLLDFFVIMINYNCEFKYFRLNFITHCTIFSSYSHISSVHYIQLCLVTVIYVFDSTNPSRVESIDI